jgi:hypothetical protein
LAVEIHPPAADRCQAKIEIPNNGMILGFQFRLSVISAENPGFAGACFGLFFE